MAQDYSTSKSPCECARVCGHVQASLQESGRLQKADVIPYIMSMQEPAAVALAESSIAQLEQRLTDLQDVATSRLRKQVNVQCAPIWVHGCEPLVLLSHSSIVIASWMSATHLSRQVNTLVLCWSTGHGTHSFHPIYCRGMVNIVWL
jgi:hypothetical protein